MNRRTLIIIIGFLSMLAALILPHMRPTTDASNRIRQDYRRAEAPVSRFGSNLREVDQSAPNPYPVWKCLCGTISSGAWLPDRDEVADQLLEILGLNTRASEAREPTGQSAISLERFDVKKVEHDT